MSQNNPEQLRVLRITPSHEVPEAYHLPSGFFKLNTNQSLWSELGKVPSAAALKLERGLLANPIKDTSYKLVAKPNTPIRSGSEVWIEGTVFGFSTTMPDIDELNAHLQDGPRPTANIIASPLGPDLLLCHRSVPFGNFLKEAIRNIRAVRYADVLQTGSDATGIFSAYDKGTLLGATLIPPAISFEDTANRIHDLASA